MGEIAEMKQNGILCADCGAYVGDDVGYELLCGDCLREEREREKENEKNRP